MSLPVVILLVTATVVAGVGLVVARRSRGAAGVASAAVVLVGVAGVAYVRAVTPEGMGGLGHALVGGLLLWVAVVPAAAVLVGLVAKDVADRRRRSRDRPRDAP